MSTRSSENRYKERIRLLKEAINNDCLEGEICPNCFHELEDRQHKLNLSISDYQTSSCITKRQMINNALSEIKHFKQLNVLSCQSKVESEQDSLNSYVCAKCNRSYFGEMKYIAQAADTKALSFFGTDMTKIYPADIYSFPIISSDYDSLIEEIWSESAESSLTPRNMIDTTEDVITGEVLGQLKTFFVHFTKKVYDRYESPIRLYPQSHAGIIEAGRKPKVPASGADMAIWMGPLTKEQSRLLDSFQKGQIEFDKLPEIVGSGITIQAKRENGSIDKKQLNDLLEYGSIKREGLGLLGIAGKLFMRYSQEQPLVSVLSGDFTYALYESSLLKSQETVSLSKALKELSEYCSATPLKNFIQAYLAGKIGTPLLMLKDIMGLPIPRLIVATPPEPKAPGPLFRQSITTKLDDWTSDLHNKLKEIDNLESYLIQQKLADQENIRYRKA